MGGYSVAWKEKTRNPYGILVGKPVGKWLFVRPRRRPEDKIEMDFKQIGCDVDGTGSESCPMASL
jgi:hypothetical protein